MTSGPRWLINISYEELAEVEAEAEVEMEEDAAIAIWKIHRENATAREEKLQRRLQCEMRV